MVHKKPVALIILDGFGYSQEHAGNAIAQAHIPHLKNWLLHYPNTIIQASGTAVGLPAGHSGNSEVGHLTIGSGRITMQPLTFIDQAIASGSFFSNPLLASHLTQLAQHNKTLHIIGLLSDGGSHSSTQHLYAYLKAALQSGIKKIFVHAILDGRDAPPQSAPLYLKKLEQSLQQMGVGKIGSLHGRFYAMNRDQNWERTQSSYNVLTQSTATHEVDWQKVLEHNYAHGITDEFIKPVQLDPHAIIQNGDGIIFFNYRPDSALQLTQAFTQHDFTQFPTTHLQLAFFITPVPYSRLGHLKTIALYKQPILDHTLKQILCTHKKTIFTIAETEKFAHVTYFFDGLGQQLFCHELRILIPSLDTKNYVHTPCMRAPAITAAVLKSLRKIPRDFYLINYANADMVGHSGNFNATIKAVECLDEQLAQLYQEIVIKLDGTIFITGDHGKAEYMIDQKTGTPYTAHTANPVPFIMLKNEFKDQEIPLPVKQLCDIAPFILSFMQLPIPNQMKDETQLKP